MLLYHVFSDGLEASPAHRQRWELEGVVGHGQPLQLHLHDAERETLQSVVCQVELPQGLQPRQLHTLQSVVAQVQLLQVGKLRYSLRETCNVVALEVESSQMLQLAYL